MQKTVISDRKSTRLNSSQNKAQVFEMFFTGQNQIADSHRSLGLGLALCRTILAAHKGTLTLRDNEPHGCIFSFELPKSEVSIHE